MKQSIQLGLTFFFAAVCVAAFGQDKPHVQFIYPAGGEKGTVFEAEIGGQYLNGATNILVTGQGVSVDVLKYSIKYEPIRIRQMLRGRDNKLAELEEKKGDERRKLERQIENIEKQIRLADRPEGVDPFDKKAMRKVFVANPKEQFNPQLSHRIRVRVTIDARAPAGERELRVYTPSGLSNPLYFAVGGLKEVLENEPNDDHMAPELQTVKLPAVINGQVRPGDIDHFKFDALKGDCIVVDVAARRIIPYLADAVPGWFQAVVSLYDEEGNEVAYQDDYKFNPDPVIFYDVPDPGTYTLSIRDSIYRGREDFIYRIAIGELPFITGIFPLGAQQGKAVDIALSGRNLPRNRVKGTLPEDQSEIRHVSVTDRDYRSNQMPFAISELSDTFESEPNNRPEQANAVEMPRIINGRIEHAGDRDVFSFQGKKGDRISIEVAARKLNSPLDSRIRLTGSGLKTDVINDDFVDKDATHLYLGAGLVTHHADSYLMQELSEDGTYYVELVDAQGKGGHDYAYRLTISPAMPDFKLHMEPSGVNIAPGGTAVFTVRARRSDGFNAPIQLHAEELPDGFEMSAASISVDDSMTRFTMTAPKKIEGRPLLPKIVGVAELNGKRLIREAIPVDDQMQAFLYRHLVPAQQLTLAPIEKQPPVVFEAQIPKSGVIELPIGEHSQIMFKGTIQPRGMQLVLQQAPEGIVQEKGWVGRKRLRNKEKNGKPAFDGNHAVGRIFLTVGEPLKPGDQLSLVVSALQKRGKQELYYPSPAIPIRIVAAKEAKAE